MTKVYLVIDYNNVRYVDVRKIRSYVRNRYGLSLCLIRPQPRGVDFEIADFVLDLDFTATDFVSRALAAFSARRLAVVGGFPFSDKAIVSGTRLLQELGCRSDSLTRAAAADSKWDYRQAEQEVASLFRAQNIFLPQAELVTEIKQLRMMLARCPAGLVLKPTHEGNNRGVSIVRTLDDVERAWIEAKPWFNHGLIAEEMIPFAPEYSHDGVAHLDFVTKKYSLSGLYPVEVGQEVSAELNADIAFGIRRTGRLLNYVTGSRVGGFHNEIRRHPVTGITAVVEPNRRPAGMCIWDLAERVYRINFYSFLVDSTLGEGLPRHLPDPFGTAAIRMLAAPQNSKWTISAQSLGNWQRQASSLIQEKAGGRIEFFNFRCLKEAGASVDSEVHQNGDFVAQICAFGADAQTVREGIDEFALVWHEYTRRELQLEAAV